MYKPTFDKHINIQQEKDAVVEYCTKYWTVKDNKEQFTKMVDFLFTYGMELGKNQFNAHEFSMNCNEIFKKDRELMKSKVDNEDAMDVYFARSEVKFSSHTLESLVKNGIAYDKYMPKLLKFVKNEFGELKTLKPLNWNKYLKDPTNFSDTEYGVDDDFQGSASSVGNGYVWQEFPDSVSLSTVEYNNERDRKPLECLVKGIIFQGYGTQVHNNTVDMIAEINDIFAKNVEKFNLNEILPEIKNKHLKVLFELGTYDKKTHKNKEEFEKSVGATLVCTYFTPESIYEIEEQKPSSPKRKM